ncbi:MAG: hypothetical protein RL514_279 [Verrucomicrobiota bacterium]|jgi:hypothetical protein
MTSTQVTAAPARDACADLAPPPRSLDVFLSRAELARIASAPMARVYRAFADGALTPDALDTHGQPLFLMQRLPLLKAELEKLNSPQL